MADMRYLGTIDVCQFSELFLRFLLKYEVIWKVNALKSEDETLLCTGMKE